MKIIICGGHLTPALAIIEELKDLRIKGLKEDKAQILFVGRKYPLEGESTVSAEYKVIARMGIPFVSLTTGRLQRKFTLHTIPSLLKIPIGFFQALWWVGKFRPDVILSFGGYVALPVVVAGWVWRVPIITHEQTVASGLANKIIAWFAKKICVSWPDSVGYFPRGKVVLTGNPVRKEIFKINELPRVYTRGIQRLAPSASSFSSASSSDLRPRYSWSENKNSLYPIPYTLYPVIYITGGSLGSHAINEAMAECLPQLLEKYVVIHQCGDSEKYDDYGKLKVQSAKLKTTLQERYILTKYVEPEDIGWVLDKADLVVGRAGANTVTELAALGKPAILIPLPWAGGGEQEKNAQLLVDAGTAIVLPQDKLSGEELIHQVTEMIENLNGYRKRGLEAKKLVNLSAALKIAEVIGEVYKKRREN